MPDPIYSAETRLAVYGTLAPGRVNHHQLAGLEGRWRRGTVRGEFAETGWGTTFGFPALLLDPAGPFVDVYVFESLELPDHWARLDEFEGPEYRRVITDVLVGEAELAANIYQAAAGPTTR